MTSTTSSDHKELLAFLETYGKVEYNGGSLTGDLDPTWFYPQAKPKEGPLGWIGPGSPNPPDKSVICHYTVMTTKDKAKEGPLGWIGPGSPNPLDKSVICHYTVMTTKDKAKELCDKMKGYKADDSDIYRPFGDRYSSIVFTEEKSYNPPRYSEEITQIVIPALRLLNSSITLDDLDHFSYKCDEKTNQGDSSLLLVVYHALNNVGFDISLDMLRDISKGNIVKSKNGGYLAKYEVKESVVDESRVIVSLRLRKPEIGKVYTLLSGK